MRPIAVTKGFTMIEVLVTVVVLTLGIIGIHGGFSRSLHAIKTSETILLSSFILEDTVTLPALGSWVPGNARPSLEFSESVEGFPGYEYKAESKDVMLNQAHFDQFEVRLRDPADIGMEASILLTQSQDEIHQN